MSTIQCRSSNFQFELKLVQLKDLHEKTSLSKTTQIQNTFNSLVQDVARNKQPVKLFNLLERTLPKSFETESSLKFVFLALKSVQYGLSQTSNQEYKLKWKDLTNDQLKIKIEKLQKKVDQLKNDYKPAEMKVTSELSKVVTTTPSTPDNKKENVLFNSIKGSITKSASTFMRKMSFSGSGSVSKNSMTIKQTPTRMHVADIFADPKKEQELLETTTTNTNDVSPSKKEKEEVFFWQLGVLSNLSQNPPQILATFKDDLLNAIQKDPAFIMLSNSCQNENDQTHFLESLVFFFDEVLFRMEKDLEIFEKDISSQNATTKETFVAYSFLLNLYYVSLDLDKAYIDHKWLKPDLLVKMQNLLHFEERLVQLASKIKEVPCLKTLWLRKRDIEADLAYAFLRSKNRWYTRLAFDRDVAHNLDPLLSSGLGHRTSVKELPQWLPSVLHEKKS